MSKLNINRNIFLEREELLRWQEFLINSNVNQVFLKNTLTWGIIDTSGGTTPLDFKVEVGTGSGTIKISTESKALTESGLLISQSVVDNITIPSGGAFYWLKVGHKYTNLEVGTCNITVDGQVAGSNTKFLEVVRGQITEVPVKIIFPNSTINTSVYEVVSVSDDENLILSSTSLSAETGQKYAVVGSTPLGDTVTNSQKEGLYRYDSCEITQVLETVLDTEPAGKVSNEEFWIARVVNNSGTVTVEDKRTEYWTYFIRGVNDKLDRNLNLLDLQDVDVARDNLKVYSKEQVDGLVGADETSWIAMAKGANLSNTNFDIKVRRIGKIVQITGQFQLSSSPVADSVLLSVPYASIGGSKAAPTYIVRNQMSVIETENLNHGLKYYIPVPPDPNTPTGNLEVKNSASSYVPSSTLNNIFNFNITYLAG